MSGTSVLDPGTASWILFAVFFSLMFLRVPVASRSVWRAYRSC